jgi:tetratricopeptide (TPR) repeat protein
MLTLSIGWSLLTAPAWGVSGGGRRLPVEPTKDVEDRINQLIEELGADQYARRERADEQLRELGLVAFDALLEASHHDDVEIAIRARYLVRSMPVHWSFDSDPPAVKSILSKYSHAGRDERLNRMQHLSALSKSQGIPALCRLMRFESDGLLSKQAALYVMTHWQPEVEGSRGELAQTISDTVGLSKRSAAVWLRTYAETLRDQESTVEKWDQIAQAESLDFAQFPEQTNREIVRDLFRWQADMLRRIDRQKEFFEVIHRTLDLIQGDRSELFDFVDWALEREAWNVVDEVAERYPAEFFRNNILVYRLAEAQLKRGDEERAGQTARRALAIDPEHLQGHNLIAEYLISRMLYDWAEQEYRYVIANTKPNPNDGLHLEARFLLADMLFDIEKFATAAEALRGVIAAFEDNPKVLQPNLRSVGEVRGNMHYYLALNYGQQGDRPKQKQHLREAVKNYSSNPDFLIAMHRVPDGDEEFQTDTDQLINASKSRLRDRIQFYEKVHASPRNESERLEAMDLLARSSNELAWLISNTEGDFQSALRHSQRSLELKPDYAPYLDTLGRCYFAVGDFENAVKHQARAVERSPFYQQIRRQLDQFEKALAASKAEAI